MPFCAGGGGGGGGAIQQPAHSQKLHLLVIGIGCVVLLTHILFLILL